MSEPKVPDQPKTWPVIVAVAINLIPIVGILLWGWSAFALILLYWLENVIIGVRNVASMWASAVFGGGGLMLPAAAFFSVFFTFHYGLFCLVHGIFVISMFGEAENGAFMGDSLFDVAGAVRGLFATQMNLAVGFASIMLWQVVQFILFLVRGDAARTNPLELMGAPYPRIIVLHVAIIFGGFLLMALNVPAGGYVVLALVKTAYDVAEIRGKTPGFTARGLGSKQAAGGGDDTQGLVP
ncbi:DUF6498-containing protein [Vitreimonas flagellata]|uniref:DUF6498-containing protein n=1 Tax=Vitreimonas flagellata TaxID=2560861 RepID=UPI00107523E3|nr:DUF6498-containing protein [Vitreimonas flagellata]